jgi:hypothetical protein
MKRMSKLFAMLLAFCMVLSVSAFASGEAAPAAGASVEDAYVEYIHEFLLAELEVNSSMTIDQVEDEFMPLIEAGDYTSFPADMVFSGMLNSGAAMTFEEFAAQYVPGDDGLAGTYTDGVNTLIVAEDGTFTMDKTGQNMEGEDFVLTLTGTITEAGEVTIDGMFDGDINLVELATEEQMADDIASVEAAFAAGKVAAGGDTSEEAYHAYLKEYVAAVPAVSDDQFVEFAALIDASDYTTMPADMLFNAQWWGYAAMTYDEFVAAGGVYEIPAFDPGLTAD